MDYRKVKSKLLMEWLRFLWISAITLTCIITVYLKKTNLISFNYLAGMGLQTGKVWTKSIFWPWPHFYAFLWFLLALSHSNSHSFNHFPKQFFLFQNWCKKWKKIIDRSFCQIWTMYCGEVGIHKGNGK